MISCLLTLLSLTNALAHISPTHHDHYHSASYRVASEGYSPSQRSQQAYARGLVRRTIALLPEHHQSALQDVEVRNQRHRSRGMANHQKIILHTGTIDDETEFQSVLIHEMGHIVDLGHITGHHGERTEFKDGKKPILSDDLSLMFYRISWEDPETQRFNAKRKDFVSGYAMANCFEDFAESYLMYRMHGEKFRALALDSPRLRMKYRFLQMYVFQGEEFQLEKEVHSTAMYQNMYDATLLSQKEKKLAIASR